jgi:hypothetical protein
MEENQQQQKQHSRVSADAGGLGGSIGWREAATSKHEGGRALTPRMMTQLMMSDDNAYDALNDMSRWC